MTNQEPIDLKKMPYEEAVATAMRVFGLGRAQADEMISITQGLVKGDLKTGRRVKEIAQAARRWKSKIPVVINEEENAER